MTAMGTVGEHNRRFRSMNPGSLQVHLREVNFRRMSWVHQ